MFYKRSMEKAIEEEVLYDKEKMRIFLEALGGGEK